MFLMHVSLVYSLDLDKWINDPPSESEEEDDDLRDSIFGSLDKSGDAHRSTFHDKAPKTSRKDRKKGKKGRSKKEYVSDEEVDEEELEKVNYLQLVK